MEHLAVKCWIHLWSPCFDHWDLEQQPVPRRTVLCWAIFLGAWNPSGRWPKKWTLKLPGHSRSMYQSTGAMRQCLLKIVWKLLWSLTCANIINRHPVWWLLRPVGVSPQKFTLYSCHDCVSSCSLGSLSLTLPIVSAKSFIIRWKLRHQCFFVEQFVSYTLRIHKLHMPLICRCFFSPRCRATCPAGIPPSICSLKNLRRLSLSSNRLTGPLPDPCRCIQMSCVGSSQWYNV